MASKKVKGFTLLETMFAILMVSLVFVLGIFVFQKISEWYWRYTERQNFLMEYTTLYSHLKYDIYNANDVEFNEQELILQSYEINKELSYYFKGDLVIRKQNGKTALYNIKANVGEFNEQALFLTINDTNQMIFNIPKNK